MRRRTDQSHKLRTLLYSLYNGEAASLIEIVTLDWPLRKASANCWAAKSSW